MLAQIKAPTLTGRKDSQTRGGMSFLTLSNVHKVTLSFAACSLCEQVSVIDVFAQHSSPWKT